LRVGTEYVKPERILLNILTSPPKFMRLLQLTDVVTFCTVASVSGGNSFSLAVSDVVRSMLARELGRIGAVELKIHRDFKYLDLYHWLLGDPRFVRFMSGFPTPIPSYQYSVGPNVP
jgi:hypothetical protein